MKNRFNCYKIVVIVVVFLIPSFVFSQDISFDDDVIDNTAVPVAPINSTVYVLLILGIVYAFFLIQYRKKRI
jgi:hypothetical protein